MIGSVFLVSAGLVRIGRLILSRLARTWPGKTRDLRECRKVEGRRQAKGHALKS